MLYLFAEAAPPFRLDGYTWAIVVGTATVLMTAYKFLDKFIEAKIAAKKEKNGQIQSTQPDQPVCAGAGLLPLSEKSLTKAVDELHEVTLMGQPVSEVQRQRNEAHKALLNTSDFQERNFVATKIVARELVRRRITEENGKKDNPPPGPDDTAEWDAVVDKMIKKEGK